MTDKRDDDLELENDPDLELITDALVGELDQSQIDAVQQRLDNDPAFRELAAPLIAIWQVPPRWKRKPMPRAELERHWDQFTKRAGFIHQRRKARQRRLWILATVILALALSAFLLRGRIREAYRDYRYYEDVPSRPEWITLRDGSEVLLAPGSRLRSAKRATSAGLQVVKLDGSARFRVLPPDSAGDLVPRIQPLSVKTPGGGSVALARGEFSVTTRGDTLDVEVHRPAKRGPFMGLPTNVLIFSPESATPFRVNENERARWYPGSAPKKLPAQTLEPNTGTGDKP